MTLTAYLIIDYRGNMRILKTVPRLSDNEVAFKLSVAIPRPKRPSLGEIDIALPEWVPPSGEVTVEPIPEPAPQYDDSTIQEE